MVARWCSRGGCWVAGFSLLVALFTPAALPGVARADDASMNRARESFQAAVKLEEGGSFAEALKKFQEVAVVKKTPQVLFHVGFCQEKLGQWPQALATYKQASQLASQSSDPKFIEARGTIDQALASLEQRFPSLQIKRGKGARNAVILVDGERIDDVREPLRLAPGKHLVQARARNKDNFRAEVALAEAQRASVEVIMEDLGDDKGDKDDKDDKDDRPDKGKGDKVDQGRSVGPYVALGVGGVSLAASGIFFLMRNSAEKDLKNQCIGLTCPASAKSVGDQARTMNTLTNVTVSIGAVGVGAGLIWLLASGGGDAPKAGASLRVLPDTSLSRVGASVVGAF